MPPRLGRALRLQTTKAARLAVSAFTARSHQSLTLPLLSKGERCMNESTTTPSPSDDLLAAFELAVRQLKERGHLAFDELASVLKSHGYPVSGDHPYIYRQNDCLMAWVGMSGLFWMVADRLRLHPNVQVDRAVSLRPPQYPPNLRLPIARDDTGPFTKPHWLPCEFVWRGDT